MSLTTLLGLTACERPAHAFPDKVVTTLEPFKAFYPAEDYHQDFARKNPNQGYVRQWALPKVEKVLTHFKDQVKTPEDLKAQDKK
jgi:peptide-methionine (S)-S-oxide reductase